ncbi:hypothetical protein MRX96_015518 [Rhipicephalus microplus]
MLRKQGRHCCQASRLDSPLSREKKLGRLVSSVLASGKELIRDRAAELNVSFGARCRVPLHCSNSRRHPTVTYAPVASPPVPPPRSATFRVSVPFKHMLVTEASATLVGAIYSLGVTRASCPLTRSPPLMGTSL